MSPNPRRRHPALVEPLDPRRLLSTTPLPDLTLNALSLLGDHPATYNPGDTLFPAADAACSGGPSRVATVAYALSPDDIPGNADDIPLSPRHTALAWAHNPLDTTTVPPPLAAPFVDLPATLPPGTYHLVATVDPHNAVAESNETDNTLIATDPVTVVGPISDPLPSTSPGSTLATTLHLTNRAKHKALAHRTIKTYFSADAKLSRNDTLFSTRHITTPLRPRQSISIPLSLKIPTNAPHTTHYLITVTTTPAGKRHTTYARLRHPRHHP